jgi:hypothetical protein
MALYLHWGAIHAFSKLLSVCWRWINAQFRMRHTLSSMSAFLRKSRNPLWRHSRNFKTAPILKNWWMPLRLNLLVDHACKFLVSCSVSYTLKNKTTLLCQLCLLLVYIGLWSVYWLLKGLTFSRCLYKVTQISIAETASITRNAPMLNT